MTETIVTIEQLSYGGTGVFFRPPLNGGQQNIIRESLKTNVVFTTSINGEDCYTKMAMRTDELSTDDYMYGLAKILAHTAAGALSQSGEDVVLGFQTT